MGILVLLEGEYFVILVSISKFFLLMTFTVSYQYTIEIYSTKIRGTGMGMASAVSRIGGIIMPYCGFTLMNISLFLPYALFGGLSILAGILTMFLPYDTRNRDLDYIEEQEVVSARTSMAERLPMNV